MHVNVAAGDERQGKRLPQVPEPLESQALEPVRQQFNGDPQAIAKSVEHPRVLGAEQQLVVGNPEYTAMLQAVGKVFGSHTITALVGRAPTTRDQGAEFPVTGTIPRQHDELQSGIEAKLRADDEL